MAYAKANRVFETTTTTGTGSLNLAGAAAGFQTFVDGIGNGNTCHYEINNGTDWEVGIGTVTAGSPDVLSRDTVLESTNADAKVNWGSGTKNVFVLLSAQHTAETNANNTFTGNNAFSGDNDFSGGTMTLDSATIALFATAAQGAKADTALQNYNSPFLHLQDQKTSGTAGGTFTSGAWQTRTLNTEVIDTIGSTLSSNQFTLPAGTYYLEAVCPTLNTNSSQARLQNVSDSVTTLLGQNSVTGTTAGGVAIVNGQFTIATTKTFEIQHRCSTTRATDGFGYASGWGVEVYAEVRVWKVA